MEPTGVFLSDDLPESNGWGVHSGRMINLVTEVITRISGLKDGVGVSAWSSGVVLPPRWTRLHCIAVTLPFNNHSPTLSPDVWPNDFQRFVNIAILDVTVFTTLASTTADFNCHNSVGVWLNKLLIGNLPGKLTANYRSGLYCCNSFLLTQWFV